VSKTGVNGLLLTEAKYINLSLHYLEQVRLLVCYLQDGTINWTSFNTLAVTYKISRTLSVLFSHNKPVNSYLTQLWTTVAQRPHKL